MRASLLLSAALHFGVLIWAFVSLPGAKSFEVAPVEALPVELVTISDETDLALGSPDARPPEEPVVEPVEETIEAEPATDAPGLAENDSERAATDPDAVDRQAESTAPEPAADPEPAPQEPQETEVAALPEPAADPAPEPEPAQAEPQPPAQSEPEPELEAAPAAEPESSEPTPAATAPAPRVVPRPRPTPPPRTARRAPPKQDPSDFNADRISALLNKVSPSGGGSGGAGAPVGSINGQTSARMTVSELDALRQQIQRCWNPPIGAVGAEDLVVQVRMVLNQDGTVEQIPEVSAAGVGPFYEAAADSARRAVLRCQPYSLPPEKFDLWREVRVTFDPRQLF